MSLNNKKEIFCIVFNRNQFSSQVFTGDPNAQEILPGDFIGAAGAAVIF
jgi:hypothetical protein